MNNNNKKAFASFFYNFSLFALIFHKAHIREYIVTQFDYFIATERFEKVEYNCKVDHHINDSTGFLSLN